MEINYVSTELAELRERPVAGEVLAQYARALDRAIACLTAWEAEARAIEESCENFYGE